MHKIKIITGTGISLRGNNINTDQIIPARFLKGVTFEKLGEQVFYDERFDEKNCPKPHPFNNKKYNGISILIVNRNFGCGSSREHALQALFRFGIRAIIGESFSEIFTGNCISLGIPAVTMDAENIEFVMQYIEQHPSELLTIDIENSILKFGNHTYRPYISPSSQYRFIHGKWDFTAVLLENIELIKNKHAELQYLQL